MESRGKARALLFGSIFRKVLVSPWVRIRGGRAVSAMEGPEAEVAALDMGSFYVGNLDCLEPSCGNARSADADLFTLHP